MITIRLIDNNCERYTQKPECTCLGRRWDNIAEKIQVVKPQGEENNVCAMIVLHDNEIVDHIIVGEEPIDITSNLSQYESVSIGFSFSNESGYIKNSEVKSYYFADAIKPTNFVPIPPQQEENLNNIIGKSFVRSELVGNVLNFYNIVGEIISSVDLSGFAGGGGSSGGSVDLSNYVTLDSEQTITGKKTIKAPFYVSSQNEEFYANLNVTSDESYFEMGEGDDKQVSITSSLGVLDLAYSEYLHIRSLSETSGQPNANLLVSNSTVVMGCKSTDEDIQKHLVVLKGDGFYYDNSKVLTKDALNKSISLTLKDNGAYTLTINKG